MESLLRKARLERQLTCAQLAKKVGASRALIGHYETGNRKPSPKKAQLLARILGLTTMQILESTHKLKADT